MKLLMQHCSRIHLPLCPGEALDVFLSGRHSFETERPLGQCLRRRIDFFFQSTANKRCQRELQGPRKDELCCRVNPAKWSALVGKILKTAKEDCGEGSCFLKRPSRQAESQLCPTGV